MSARRIFIMAMGYGMNHKNNTHSNLFLWDEVLLHIFYIRKTIDRHP